MTIKPLPRQKPYCTVNDFLSFLKLLFCGKLIRGDSIYEFERKFAETYNVQHALTASSCRSVFSLILDGFGIREGDEVILPAFNMSAFPKILVLRGIKPVFVDIDEKTLNIDVGKIEACITSRTKVIVAVHLFGGCCDIKSICAIAKKHRLWVIEDCANAYLTLCDGRPVGTFGDVACFSLSHSKDVPTFGGGIMITNDSALFQRILDHFEKEYKWPGGAYIAGLFVKNLIFKMATASLVFSVIIYPIMYLLSLLGIDLIGKLLSDKDRLDKSISKVRFTNIQSFIGIEKLKVGNTLQLRRVAAAKQLNQSLVNCKNIHLISSLAGSGHAYWNYVLLTKNRSALFRSLLAKGVDTKQMPDYDCNNYKIFERFRRDCPVSHRVGKEILALPMYHQLSRDDVEHMVHAVCEQN